MTTTIDTDYVLNGLGALGNDTDTIAATLYDLGIRMPSNPRHRTHCCPITQFVASHVPEGSQVLTVAGGAYIYPPHVDPDKESSPYTHIRLPKPVSDFINAFDNGRYPELEI
jgi:hypothetical protein